MTRGGLHEMVWRFLWRSESISSLSNGEMLFGFAAMVESSGSSNKWMTCQLKMRFLLLKILHILAQTFEIQGKLSTYSYLEDLEVNFIDDMILWFNFINFLKRNGVWEIMHLVSSPLLGTLRFFVCLVFTPTFKIVVYVNVIPEFFVLGVLLHHESRLPGFESRIHYLFAA